MAARLRVRSCGSLRTRRDREVTRITGSEWFQGLPRLARIALPSRGLIAVRALSPPPSQPHWRPLSLSTVPLPRQCAGARARAPGLSPPRLRRRKQRPHTTRTGDAASGRELEALVVACSNPGIHCVCLWAVCRYRKWKSSNKEVSRGIVSTVGSKGCQISSKPMPEEVSREKGM